MLQVKFIEDDGKILVEVNNEDYGRICYNHSLNLYQLETTTLNGNEVIDYYEDLEETKEQIKLEILNY